MIRPLSSLKEALMYAGIIALSVLSAVWLLLTGRRRRRAGMPAAHTKRR